MHAVTLTPASASSGSGGGAGAAAAAAIAASFAGRGTGASPTPAAVRLAPVAPPPSRSSSALPWVVPALTPEPVSAVSGTGAGAVARAIPLVENNRARDLLERLPAERGGAVVIGVTGAPGTGKSTLVDSLIRSCRQQDRRVMAIAVDPSSPFTQGALLGDRIRMQRHAGDPGVFVRSMASRGALGGIAWATADALRVGRSAGFDVLIVETVGVGQSEIDVARMADVVLLVMAPGGGDGIQILKAGIIEIADVCVVNKSDLEGADDLHRNLLVYAGPRGGSGRGAPRIVRTSALRGEGIADLRREIDDVLATRTDVHAEEARRRRTCCEIEFAVQRLAHERLATSKRSGAFEHLVSSVGSGALTPGEAARRVVEERHEPGRH